VDWHGREVQLANLRIDLERLLKTVRQHYSAKTFARCQLLLERLVEGYNRAEIRLELGWSESTYDFTMSLIRDMAQFAEGYQRVPNRCAKMSEAERASIDRMHRAGYTQPEIARRVGRDPKTVWRVLQQTQ
jgi:DNA-directed RNA polymerase specialized sigma24 family protein